MKTWHRAGLWLASILILTGCSTMIAGGSRHADVLKEGVPRQAVTEKLGKPQSSEKSAHAVGDDGSACVVDSYLITGNPPNPGLARTYMEIDLMTLGVSEILFFPMELIRSTLASFETREVAVMYCKKQGGEVVRGMPLHR